MSLNYYNIDTLHPEILTIGTYTEFAPFSYEINGKILGSDITFLTKFANHIGYQTNIVTMSFSELWKAPDQNRCDISAAGIMSRNDRDIGNNAKWRNITNIVGNNLFAQPADLGAHPQIFAALNQDLKGGELIGPKFISFGRPIVETFSVCDLGFNPTTLLMETCEEKHLDALWKQSEELSGISY